MPQSLLAAFHYFAMILCLKIIINDSRKWTKDLIYFVPILFLGTLFVEITSIFALGNTLVLFLLGAFLFFKKDYPLTKAIILASVAYLTAILMTNGPRLLIVLLFPDLLHLQYRLWYIWPLYFFSTHLVAPTLLSFWLVKKTDKIRNRIKTNLDYQIVLANLLIILPISFDNILLVTSLQEADFRHFQIWLFFSALIFVFLFLFGFILYMRSVDNQKQVRQKKAEQEALLQYTKEIEKQSTSMRKFKHDYQNILMSLESYIDEKDYEGLTVYFKEKIITVSRSIIDQDFTLLRLEAVKVTEIKSILVNKIITAQENDLLIHLEIRGVIDEVAVDSIVLVRMLGIILDNAIEELIQVGQEGSEGTLLIGIWKVEDEITFLVQNTCRSTKLKLHQLQENGFSTKEKGRGLGLNNLLELVKEEPSLYLETSIIDNQFIQKITLGG